MSKCHLCGIPDAQAVLVKCQWFGKGTKWLCVDCLRSQGPAAQSRAGRDPARAPAGGRWRRERAE